MLIKVDHDEAPVVSFEVARNDDLMTTHQFIVLPSYISDHCVFQGSSFGNCDQISVYERATDKGLFVLFVVGPLVQQVDIVVDYFVIYPSTRIKRCKRMISVYEDGLTIKIVLAWGEHYSRRPFFWSQYRCRWLCSMH